MSCRRKFEKKGGFSLIEVVLAIGIFLVTVLALVGLIGPTLQSVEDVESVDEIASVVNTVNAFLQGSPLIATDPESKFDAVYQAVESDGHATIFVFRRFIDDVGTDIELAIGFVEEPSVDVRARLDLNQDFENVSGSLFRVVLSASSATPESSLTGPRDTSSGIYTLNTSDPAVYPEGYLAMELRIFSEDWNPGFDPGLLPPYGEIGADASLENLSEIEPLFTYNTAIVR